MYSAALDIPNIPGFRRDYAQRNFAALSRHREQQYKMEAAAAAAAAANTGTSGGNQQWGPPAAGAAANGSNAPPPAPGMLGGQQQQQQQQVAAPPPWLVQPGDTLRFRCYFEEPVVDHPSFGGRAATHKMRVRKMTLTYFLQDKSVAMHELKTENSGMVQGRFLKRTQLFRDDGAPFTPNDFRVGGSFFLNMRVFTVSLFEEGFSRELVRERVCSSSVLCRCAFLFRRLAD